MEPRGPSRRLDRRLVPVVFIVLAVILVATIALAVSLIRPPDLEPVPIPSASSA